MSTESMITPPSSLTQFILIGAGDHAGVLIDVLRLLDRRILFATDEDVSMHGREISGVQVKGGDECVLEHAPDSVSLVNGVGSVSRPTARRQVFERFHRQGYNFETVIHPSAVVARSAELGEGAQVMAGAVVQPSAQIGANALINTGASIDHDCIIGPHVHIAPGATLSGRVHVHDTSHIGAGAIIIQGVDIGRQAVVGAGGVVVRNVSAGMTVVGVPAREIQG